MPTKEYRALIFAIGLAGLAVSDAASGEVRYRVVRLRPPLDWYVYEVLGISSGGQVVGRCIDDAGNLAFVWHEQAGMLLLGDLPGGLNGSYAAGINSAGHIVGTGSSEAASNEAFLWMAQTGMIGLGDLPGGIPSSRAAALNDFGYAAGTGRSALGDEAFIWHVTTGMIALGDLPGANYQSYGLDINNANAVVGVSSSERSWSGEGFIWDAEHGIRSMGLSPRGELNIIAHAINDLGEVTGNLVLDGEPARAYVWHADTGYRIVGPIDEPHLSMAPSDINDRSEVVGIIEYGIGPPDPPRPHAFIWDAQRGVRLLDQLIDPCETPVCDFLDELHINNSGQVATRCRSPERNEALLLKPYIPGDLDEDGDVALDDLVRMLGNFGRLGDAAYADGDVEGCDADVDLVDLTRLLANFGEAYP